MPTIQELSPEIGPGGLLAQALGGLAGNAYRRHLNEQDEMRKRALAQQKQRQEASALQQALSGLPENATPEQQFKAIMGSDISDESKKLALHFYENQAKTNALGAAKTQRNELDKKKLEAAQAKIDLAKKKDEDRANLLRGIFPNLAPPSTQPTSLPPQTQTSTPPEGTQSAPILPDTSQTQPSSPAINPPTQKAFNPADIPDEQIAALATVDPNLAKILQSQKDAASTRLRQEKEFEYKRAAPILEEADEIRRVTPSLRSSLDTILTATDDVGLWDYIANLTHIEPLRTGKGALFLTAGKDFFLGNIRKVGNRPNMWVEQQLIDMQPKIGRSKEANQSVAEFMRFKIDTDEKYAETIDMLENQYKKDLGYVPGNIGVAAHKIIQPYIEKRQKELAYDLRVIHEKENPRTLTDFRKVRKGTPLTVEKAKAFLDRFKGDEKKAMQAAKQLGYEIPDEDIYIRGQ